MALSDADAARLTALKAAKDQLLKGTAVARAQVGGRLVDYVKADLTRLQGEIDSLEADAASTAPARKRGALRFRSCIR